MKGELYFKDIRQTEKTLYTLSNKLFYEPFEYNYEPSEEYINNIKDIQKEISNGWRITRDKFWFAVHPDEKLLTVQKNNVDITLDTLPTQGWKVHVSATLPNSLSILKKVGKIALANKVPFKFALDKKVLSYINSKRWHRGSSGKFITIYPSNPLSFKNLLEHLYIELRDAEGPHILSDRRYKDCQVLYYRYGGITLTKCLEITGERIPVIRSPDGEVIHDVRTPYFSLPTWVEDPFPNDEISPKEITLNNGRYHIKRAVNFSNTGGVYLATDRSTGTDVIIKEARANTQTDYNGNNALTLLKKEHAMLDTLEDTGIVPKPVELFQEWENLFLAQEYLVGEKLTTFMKGHSPNSTSLIETQQFYEVFNKVFTNLAKAVALLHDRGIIFGDLSVNNIIIDATTYSVRLIDFEGAYRPDIDQPINIFTPGFRDVLKTHNISPTAEDDSYALAACMFHYIFAVSAISSLRCDLYDTVLKTILNDIGWSQTEVYKIIHSLSKGTLTCTQASELLEKPVQILQPEINDNIEPNFHSEAINELSQFIIANMRLERRDALFPADPFIYRTNSLSLGFGACGVLYSLKKCGVDIPEEAYDWLKRELDAVKPDDLSPGLLTGTSGIAWCLYELGFEDHATRFLEMANNNGLLNQNHSYFYGMAGIGMANLFMYFRTKIPHYLTKACELAEVILKNVKEGNKGIYWENNGLVHLGYGYGQSGVALFLHRLFQITGIEKYLSLGKRALDFDLSHGIEGEAGLLSFPQYPSGRLVYPFLEVGTAGITRVAIRYGMRDQIDNLLPNLNMKYALFSGFLLGLGGIIDVYTDAYIFSDNQKFLGMAKRPISGIKDVYLIKQLNGSATPGEGLLRISCDYATGVAGVLRALHRYTNFDNADFVLDEITSTKQQ